MDIRKCRTTRILVLNFNGAQNTINCIRSLLCDPLVSNDQIIVIDNASTDDSVGVIQSEFPGIRIRMNSSNLGYAGGMNNAIPDVLREDTEFILILNNDTIVHVDALGTLHRTLEESKDVGIVGPAVLDMGSERVQSLGVRIDWTRGRSIGRHAGCRHSETQPGIEEVDFVSGCAMLVKREVFERVGLFPPNFLLYGEDMDLCIRAARAGFRVVCDSRAVVEHMEGSTVDRYPGLQAFYSTRNRFLIMKRHGSICQFVATSMLTMLFYLPLSCLLIVARRQPLSIACSRAAGVVEGLKHSLSESRLEPQQSLRR